jgi:hypothetical protein
MTTDQTPADMPPETPSENEDEVEQASENSFFIPKDILGDKSYKKGDTISLEVMGEDEDGDLEVCLPSAEGGGWESELKQKLSDAGKEGM